MKLFVKTAAALLAAAVFFGFASCKNATQDVEVTGQIGQLHSYYYTAEGELLDADGDIIWSCYSDESKGVFANISWTPSPYKNFCRYEISIPYKYTYNDTEYNDTLNISVYKYGSKYYETDYKKTTSSTYEPYLKEVSVDPSARTVNLNWDFKTDDGTVRIYDITLKRL